MVPSIGLFQLLMRGSLIACCFSIFYVHPVQASSISARDIMEKNDAAQRHSDVKASARLETAGGKRKPATKEFTWWRRLKEDGVRFETLTRFHAPAEVRDEAILFLESGDENEILIWLPAFKKVRRVETQQQSGSFMGSDFSYTDITAVHVSDFNHKTLKTEPCPGTPTVSCWVVESIPARESVRDRMQYDKFETWVRQDNFMAEKVEYYDLKGKLTKRLLASEIRKVGQRWFAHHLKMNRLSGEMQGASTEIDFKDVQVNKGLDRSLFAKQNLGRR